MRVKISEMMVRPAPNMESMANLRPDFEIRSRSAKLHRMGGAPAVGAGGRPFGAGFHWIGLLLAAPHTCGVAGRAIAGRQPVAYRSEEHTSELQSLRHL